MHTLKCGLILCGVTLAMCSKLRITTSNNCGVSATSSTDWRFSAMNYIMGLKNLNGRYYLFGDIHEKNQRRIVFLNRLEETGERERERERDI